MGKKYIIELPENTHWIQWLMEGTEDHHPYMDFKSVENLTHYTEPDLEQVRKEAHDKGYHEGHNACFETAKDIMEEKKNEAYQRGLSDAWDAARKISTTPIKELKKILDIEEDDNGMLWPFHEYTASEAIEKIRQYEQKEIKVGDEVENTQTGVKFIVTHQWKNNRGEQGVSGLNYECSAFSTTIDLVRKTGRHFPEIAAVLQKMRGEQE